MLSLSYIVALVALTIFAWGPVARLLGLGDGSPGYTGSDSTSPSSSSSSSSSSPRSRHPRPNLNASLIALEDDDDDDDDDVFSSSSTTTTSCPPATYATHVVSRAPLVLYLEGFVSAAERAHLLSLAAGAYEPSTVTDDAGTLRRDESVRLSDVAVVERTPATRCVEARARALQGWRDELWLERLRVQRYGVGGKYGHHFDLCDMSEMGMDARHGYGRVSSMMVWLDDGNGTLVGGGTEFPLLRRPGADARWCRFIECPEEGNDKASKQQQPQRGVVFKPVLGNAVYWENFPPGTVAGPGYDESWHAGLPVEAGVKVGLNIWSLGRLD
ncbi:oxidoreductase [Gaeumannomyces tritici R3-111a-1]|uniref:Oxidoreductase n=1 Tax=Gaeumannomyces tritici (strain R3-111a-1) TaxID=644352 RepID=J3P7H9_GAET3|nr:oxidoreductase [Gaeumannomyces tritici R3-111a-1]EJT72610.1 oxidoreductase [Gaeumannomyces tritici R3-111a-1]